MVPTLFDLTGRVALVTGGNKGLGKAMARGLAEAGADIIIASRHEDQLQAALQEIVAGTGRRGVYCVADVGVRQDLIRLARFALESFGRVDILVNNAGMNIPQPIDAITDEVWDRMLAVNLTAAMVLSRELVPQMKARRWGRIVHISSILGQVSKEKRNAYSATKAALMGLARASAIDLGPYNITVNCIAPGPFLTDMPMSLLSEEEKAAFAQRTALGRWAEPRELVGPILLLCSEAGSYITGQTLFVDGGWLAR
ncbi:MAG: SDR family oxidoreductase [Gemmataceae bacterium]|nr:SDR family oxidoreductase [Gemmataceae bacterium]MDW8242930.1 SDR family oxidoreductase [Thermogemmata sp.]